MTKNNTSPMHLIIGVIFINLFFTDFSMGQTMSNEMDKELWEKAMAIHRNARVIDAHAHKLVFGAEDREKTFPDAGQLGIQQLKQGGIDGVAMYFAYYPIEGKPLYYQVKQDIQHLHQRIRTYAPGVAVASDLSGFKKGLERNEPVVLPGVEYFYGALDGKPSTIDSLHKLGVRLLMLMDNEHDKLSFNGSDPAGGRNLTPLAQETIERMNELGMLIDITHLDDQMQKLVIDHSKAPVIASHSSMRAVHKVQRNIPDDLVEKLAEKGGAIMITFNSGDLAGLEKGRCRIEELIDHIDHAVKIAGPDHVGIGSDFNGAGTRSPVGLEDASGFPIITYHLLKRGYTTEQIKKIMGGNYIRLLERVLN